MAITQECCEQYWTRTGGNTPQGTNYTVTFLPSQKISKLDEQDMQDTAGEVMYSYGPPYMAEQKQDNQFEHTFSSYVRIRDVALKICMRQWMIGRSGERGSGISVLAAWHNDDDTLQVWTEEVTKNICCVNAEKQFSILKRSNCGIQWSKPDGLRNFNQVARIFMIRQSQLDQKALISRLHCKWQRQIQWEELREEYQHLSPM